MNEKLKKMIEARMNKKSELEKRAQADDIKIEELRSIKEEMTTLDSQIEELRSLIGPEPKEQNERTKAVNEEKTQERSADFKPNKGFEKRDEAKMNQPNEKENRMKDFGDALKERRAVTVAESDIVLPKHDSSSINPNFLEVSNLVDAVNVLNLPGGESYVQPYEKGTAMGGYTAEGADYNEAEVTFGHADITKAKLTAYSEMTEELEKLPSAPYAQTILAGIQKSVRKKLGKEILIGDGAANHLVGIFSEKAEAIDKATDVELSKIDNTTLDEIIFSYGGDEAVEGQCVLILSKKDLKAFSAVRTTDGKPFYNITVSGNGGSGTINTIPFIINSACGSVSDSKTTSGAYCMAYGNLANYQLTVFSPLEVKRSDDFKFKSGMIAHRGSVFVGGNVVSYNGFVRIKKAATA